MYRGKQNAVKRRHTHPFRVWTSKESKQGGGELSRENKAFLDNLIEKEKAQTPLRVEAPEVVNEWVPGSIRVGVIAKKIGIYPMWTKEGKRTLSTLLQVIDNHVIRSYTSEEYKNVVTHQQRWRSDGLGCMIVGADSSDPRRFTAQYQGLFREAGVMPKAKLTRFHVTDNALLQPGTPLHATHFHAGDFVDVFGITRDHGFQGVVKRWRFKGGPRSHGCTKFHRRPGSIGMVV